MLALLEAQERGESIGNSCAFCVRIARRRMIDECRRTRPVAAGSLTERASDEISALDAGVEVDWVSRLANEGVHLTPVLKCVLSRITSGMAETKHWRSRRVSDQRIGEATQFTLDTNGPQARREVVFECTPATAGIKADLIAAMSEGWDTTVTDQNEDRTFDDDDTLDFQQ
jgi:hypothetical protein